MKRASIYMLKTAEERKVISRKNNARNKQRAFEKEMGIIGLNEFGDTMHLPAPTASDIDLLRAEVRSLRDELGSLKEFMRVSATAFLEGTKQENNNEVPNGNGGD